MKNIHPTPADAVESSRSGAREMPVNAERREATKDPEPLLRPAEERAARRFVERVRREVPASLVQASLFGSRARRQARLDSDVDILLVFHWLPPDREPHASHAEQIAEEEARSSGIPVTTWSVSREDLRRGRRTPMLVDALEDSVPLWWERRPLRPVEFTPLDALHCVEALLARVDEGSREVAEHLARGRGAEVVRRSRDDVVRLCTAGLLLRGCTRPRRGEAVVRFVKAARWDPPLPPEARRVLSWAAASYGPEGRDDEAQPTPPPGGPAAAARTIDRLRRRVAGEARRLAWLRAGAGT